MIHGRVRLDFCDAITGKVKDRIEGDNTFTNAIDSLLNKCPCGADRATLDGTKGNTFESQLNFVNSALGGVLLFPGDVTSGANALYEPLNNQPTAYASILGQDTTDSKTGYFSSYDSRDIEGGYRFVYEWGASFGNGNIKTVCLTNAYGGEAYGKKAYFGDKFLCLMPAFGASIRALGWCDDYFYYIKGHNSQFSANDQVRRIKRPLYEMFINQAAMLDSNSELFYTHGSDSSYNSSRVGLDPVGKKVYIMYGAAGTTKTLAVCDIASFNPLTPYTPSSASTSTVTFSQSMPVRSGQYIMIAKRDNYIYFCKSYDNSGAAVISRLNLNNNADYKEISVSTATANGDLAIMTDTSEINGAGFILGNEQTVGGETVIPVYETTSQYQHVIMNRYGVWQAIKMISSTGQGPNMIGFQVNPYYMASKFVLDSVKNKDNTKTMKLIYEVTHS